MLGTEIAGVDAARVVLAFGTVEDQVDGIPSTRAEEDMGREPCIRATDVSSTYRAILSHAQTLWALLPMADSTWPDYWRVAEKKIGESEQYEAWVAET